MLVPSDVVESLRRAEACFWSNQDFSPWGEDPADLEPKILAAEDRLRRAVPLLARMFPQTAGTDQPLRSPLLTVGRLRASFGLTDADGQWLIKADHQLPVAGSIKARGGFHEVIALAERLCIANGLLTEGDNLSRMMDAPARALFARHCVAVGSTGNLGMSIGLAANALGFRAEVHMSHDAKAWKKDRLRRQGVNVIEHQGDYASAVAAGRAIADLDPQIHFVDDEHSVDLFAGYAAAASEVRSQFEEAGIVVDEDHPLFVYIPCGVGGAPGGITYGLKRQFGDHVHCFFAEPVQAPCMLVQMLAGPDRPMSVYEMGLNNRTIADGLAVGQASPLVAPLMSTRLDGIYTVSDTQLMALVQRVHASETLKIEPSAAAGVAGPLWIARTQQARSYLERTGLKDKLPGATHLIWTTGGSLLPDDEFDALLRAEAVDLSSFPA